MTIYDAPINSLQGEPLDLHGFEDKAVLVVNVASRCGLTPQYSGLEALQERYVDSRLHRARGALQPVRRPGARLGRGDRHLLLDHLRGDLPDDREGRGERRRAVTASTPS